MTRNVICCFFAAVIMLVCQTRSGLAHNMDEAKQRILDIIAEKKATVGVAVIHDGTPILVINNESRFPLMSVFKFHQALAVANHLQSAKMPVSTTLFLNGDELAPDTYSPLRDRYPNGNLFLTIENLLAYSVRLSDNNASDILFRHIIDPAGTDSYIRSLGIENFSITETEQDMHDDLDNCYKNWTTPLAAARLLEIFLRGNILQPEYHELIKALLLGCETGADRLAKPLPLDKVKIGHKTGSGDKNARGEIIALNDLGFIMLPDGSEYVIAVFIKNSLESFADTAEIIADISEIVYNSLASVAE